MAKAAGYAAAFSFDNLEDFTTGIDEVLASEGPVFIHLAVEPQIENTPVQFRPRASRTVQMAFRELPEALGVR
jgi:thiamine pyrophosphate-dependent acetolactate synthase large subunit-like protein